MKKQIELLNFASDSELSGIEGVCFDIDDTFSSRGKLTAQAFDALWRLKNAGFFLVPVTGRPAGWCDHIARFWPVDAVIGENGAFVFFMKDGRLSRYDLLSKDDVREAKLKLENLRLGILKNFPNASFASDQMYREYDLAVDFCEDVLPWNEVEIDRLINYCLDQGAKCKLSSIHVNTWFGDYDKQMATRKWLLGGAPGLERKLPEKKRWIYVGDSPNDAPAFAIFDRSVGVANIARYLDRLSDCPTWITSSECGDGFVELADRLISLR